MNKKYSYILLVLTVFIVIYILTSNTLLKKSAGQKINDDTPLPSTDYITYEEAKEILKENMNAYYMRGEYLHYNTSKTSYNISKTPKKSTSPEESTSQDFGYSICSSFVDDLFYHTFGMITADSGKTKTYQNNYIPKLSNNFCDQAKDYKDKNMCETGQVKDKCKGEYLLYYENTKDNILYYYTGDDNTPADTLEKIADVVQTGDVFAFSGHVMIVYDVVEKNPETGKKDVLLINVNSTDSDYVYTKIEPNGDGKIKYYFNKTSTNNEIFNLNDERAFMHNLGTVKFQWLSKSGSFIDGKTQKLRCDIKREECSITRFFYKNGENISFHYNIDESQIKIKNSKTRTKLPGIFIHKTSSVLDNGTVNPGDEITYTIKIQNNSGMNKVNGEKKYSKFYISENILSDKFDFVSSNYDYIINNNEVIWTVNSLDAWQSIDISYTVKVKNKDELVNQNISATGKVYVDNEGYITTGTITNKIIRKKSEKINTYSECYSNLKENKDGLNLIDEIYKCVYNVDLNLSVFSVTNNTNNMFSKLMNIVNETAVSLVRNDENKRYYDMILNNYWNSTILRPKLDSSGFYYYYTAFSRYSSADRATTVYKEHFRDGDILIYYNDDTYTDETLKYTNEQGVYAYIFLNGKFIGKNYSGSINERNEFTYEYYPESMRNTNLFEGEHSEEELIFANYQTLFGKDYYVILRPELVISKIKFDSNTGTGTMDNQIIDENKAVKINSNKFKKEGYKFTKWNTKPDGTGIKYDDNQEIFLTNDITLYANWEVNKYTVTFNSNRGSNVASQTINYNSKVTKPSNPTRECYTFKEWQLNGKTYDFSKPVTNNITLTAIWEENLNTILKNNGYVINNNYISKFTLGDTITQIKNKLGTGVTIESKTSIISTGTVIKKENESYTVVIKGDLTGDGKVNSGDLLQMRKHLLEEVNLDGAYKEAGIIESVGNIKSLDLLRLRQYLLGEYNFS